MAILNQQTLDFMSYGVEQTERMGQRLGQLLQPGDLICLSGELGAGKTAMTRGIGRGWGTEQRVTSPTFTLINEYKRPFDTHTLYHIDTYRLAQPEDAWTLGLEDIFDAEETMIIEWPERIEAILPPERLWVSLTHEDENRRRVQMVAQGKRPFALLHAFKQHAFGSTTR